MVGISKTHKQGENILQLNVTISFTIKERRMTSLMA